MKNYRRNAYFTICNLVLVASLAGTLSVQALETKALLPDGPSKALLENKKPIYSETSGSVPVDFSQALTVFSQPNFLSNVQTAYNELITDDGTPEFNIRQTAENTYFYVNRHGERTDISEVMRGASSDKTFAIIFYSSGRRSFGKFQALIHVQITDCGDLGVHYTAAVYAYPENAFSRFFARHLGLVDRYFKKKTTHLTEMITVITCSLCEQVEVTKEEAEKAEEKS
ncbi:hypothetical protein P4E94_12075 [Pontiellaceae bacterium B12219]|nr:hypothetical protein [Pontiellaceae bacterium B12219]